MENKMQSFYNFRERFYTVLPMNLPYGQQVFAPLRDQQSMDDLARLTRSIGQVLRLEDIKDVPEQTFLTETFDLTSAQKAGINSLTSRFTGDATLRLKRHQVENGVLYEDIFDERSKTVKRQVERFDCGKIDYILDRADEFKKIVIFANYTEQVDAIAEALVKAGKNVFIMDSRTKDRKAVEVGAENADSAYIVAQASVSSEWEFKSCPVMIFASFSNKNLDYIQGCGRIQRYDAVKKNLYIKLVTVYDTLNNKDNIDKRWHDVIMSGKDFNEALFKEENGKK